MVLTIEALLQEIQIVVLLPEAVGFDETRPHHLGQRRQVRTLFQLPQGGERNTKQFVLEAGSIKRLAVLHRQHNRSMPLLPSPLPALSLRLCRSAYQPGP